MSRWLLLLLLLPAAQAAPGTVIERRVKIVRRDAVNRVSEIQRDERLRYQDGCLAIEDLTFGTLFVIRGDKKLVWVADPHSGTYSELTFDEVGKRRRELIDEIAQAKARVAGSNDEEPLAETLEGLGEYAAPPKVEIKPTDKKEAVAGRACEGRQVLVNGDRQKLDVLVDATLSDALPAFELLSALGAFPPAVSDALKQLGGFPLKGTIRYALFMDRVTEEQEATSVKRESIPAAAFDLPAGLKKIPLKGFDREESRKPAKPKDFVKSFKEDEIDRENNPMKDASKDKEKPK